MRGGNAVPDKGELRPWCGELPAFRRKSGSARQAPRPLSAAF